MSNSSKLNLWRELFSQYRQSDLTVAQFCQQHHVRVHQFYYWREKVEAVSSRDSALVPVQIPATRTVADVDLCSLCLRLPNGVEVNGLSTEQLHALLPGIASL